MPRRNGSPCAPARITKNAQQRSWTCDPFEHFLPLYESVRRWKDRRKRLAFPLFPGYLFVRISLQERLRVLLTPGVVRLVGFDNRPAALPDEEIEALRSVMVHGIHSEPHPYLRVGRRYGSRGEHWREWRACCTQERPGASGVVDRSDSPISDDRSGFRRCWDDLNG